MARLLYLAFGNAVVILYGLNRRCFLSVYDTFSLLLQCWKQGQLRLASIAIKTMVSSKCYLRVMAIRVHSNVYARLTSTLLSHLDPFCMLGASAAA